MGQALIGFTGFTAGAPFTRAGAAIAVAVVVMAEALLLEIPEQFDAAFGENGSVGDVGLRLGGGAADWLGDAVGGGVTHAVCLALCDGLGKCGVAFLDEFDGGGPGFGGFLQE